MTSILKYSLIAAVVTLLFLDIQAQTQQKETTTHKTSTKVKTTAKKPAPAAPVKEITISLKNMAERPVAIFVGEKAELRDPKIKEVGGLTTNTIYVKTNQVVCVMSKDGKKVMACSNVRAGNTYMEVNNAATAISVK